MYEFAKYAFNKSHGAAYAVIAAQTAWLAKYHPVIFMKANMNTYIGSPKKLKYYLGQCIQNGIQMLPPSINESQQKFSLNHDATGIRFGLKGVKNVGSASISILEEQKARGRFVSLQNFIERMIKYHKLNRRALEGLIYVGALDEFEGTRAAKIAFLDEMIKIVKEDKSISDGYNTIFDLADEIGISDMVSMKDIPIPYVEEMSKDEKFAKELEFSGFYITGHPLEDYKVVLKLENVLPSSTFKTSDEDDDEDDEGGNNTEGSVNDYIGTKVKVAGVIAGYEKKQTRSNKPMATFKLQDMVGEVSIIAFENALKQMELADGMKVIVEGYVDQNDFGIQIKANNICELTDADIAIKNVNVYPSVVSKYSVPLK
jgi:DNA polymerase-3 subunit alpha